MAKHTAAITTSPSKLPAALTQQLRSTTPTLYKLLPPDIDAEQFRAALWLTLTTTRGLVEDCTPASIMQCVVKAATHGMLPGTDCYFLPFRNKRAGSGKKQAAFVPGYEGIIRALDRTGKVRKAFAHPVYTNDHFVIDLLADICEHRPPRHGPRGTLESYYGCILMRDGTRHVQPMSLEELDAIRRQAPAHEEGPWATHPVAMARKTAIKQVAKYVHLTPQVQALLAGDEARAAQDIPASRVQQHINDLYGGDDAAPAFDQRTGEILDDESDAQPSLLPGVPKQVD